MRRCVPGGGTDIIYESALLAAGQILPDDPSAIKHMILLTDGGANPGASEAVTRSLNEDHGITLSVVAVGQGYAPWIRNLPLAGNGNFHEAFDVSTIPSIFTAETVLATRSYIFEEEFAPVLTARSPIMDGITAAPTLNGYVATTEKDTATVIMRGPEDDPLLASWQYGLGRAVSFTSDASARWGVNWVTWDDYARFWGQAIRWTITEGTDSNLEVHVEQRGEEAFLVVDARDDDGEYLNGLDLTTAITPPDLDDVGDAPDTLTIPQVAPGRYEVAFTPEDEGAYLVRVVGSTGSVEETANVSVAQTAGWVLSYSAEYQLQETDLRHLDAIASLTGGSSLETTPEAVFEHDLTLQNATEPIWQLLLTLAALLLILDIAVRRIVITPSDIAAARGAITRSVGIGRDEHRRTATSGRMTGLMDAKRRASTVTDAPSLAESDQPVTPTPAAETRASAPPPQPARRRRRSTEQAQADSPSGSLASRLLETRKKEGDED